MSAAAKAAGTSELAVPRTVVHLADIPMLGSGKTDYVRLKSLAESKQPSQASAAAVTG